MKYNTKQLYVAGTVSGLRARVEGLKIGST